MKTKTFAPLWTASLALFLSAAANVSATEYIYRDIMGNSPPNQKCIDKEQATSRATDSYYVNRAAKTFCEVQGYGWHVAELTGQGQLVCDECSAGNDQKLYQCHMQDIAVKCQRIKPGSVGMMPGKG